MIIDQKISDLDPELSAAVTAELQRQEEHIELIASENYASPGVMAPGIGVDKQIRRGISVTSILRRL